MSNNLRQIAKDLRSFVKRCKDVHYSDSLLITFLVTGLLINLGQVILIMTGELLLEDVVENSWNIIEEIMT